MRREGDTGKATNNLTLFNYACDEHVKSGAKVKASTWVVRLVLQCYACNAKTSEPMVLDASNA